MIARLYGPPVLLAAALYVSPASGEDAATAGKKLARKHCARCHAIAQSDTSRLPAAPPFRIIAGRYSVWSLEEALGEGIVVGHSEMPEFKLPARQINELLTYMDTLTPPKK